MTVKKAIDIVDERFPNDYSTEEKQNWLKQLEDKVLHEVFMTHKEEYERPELLDAVSTDIPNAKLCIPDRFAENIYVHYLQAKLCYWYHEIDKFNDAETYFMNDYDEFKREYHRTHTPISVRTYF